MAELKNEGLPYRLYTEHPEIVPVGWDGRPAPNRDVDYLAESFLAETERWYDAVLPVLAERQPSSGGPLIAVQLDNEIGMLAWIGNAPDLSPPPWRTSGAGAGSGTGPICRGGTQRIDHGSRSSGPPRWPGQPRSGSTSAGSAATGSPATWRC